MSPDRELDALAGEYVLGLAEPEDAAEIERRMRQEPELARLVSVWRERFAPLDMVADRIEPGEALWQRITAELPAAAPSPAVAKAPTGVRPTSSLWSSIGFWRGSAFATGFASVALVAALGSVLLRPEPQPVVVAVLQGEASAGPGAIVEAFADGSIRLRPLVDIAVPEGKTLQVWTLWDRAVGPVPLGLLQQAQESRLAREGQPVPRSEQLYEITLEPEGGSPTGRPTGPILYKGLASRPL
jgi:anti-sigma-K factor RskA